MATIRPFMAVRPASGLEDRIASLPYDVFNRKEATEYVSTHPDSFLKIDRAETCFSDEIDTYDKIVYEKALEIYEEKKSNGQFVKDSSPCLYLYEQTMSGRIQTGLVCVASVEEYLNGTIKKHENTRADKEKDRINHVDSLSAQTGPIFLAYRQREKLADIFESIKKEAPYCSFENNGVLQRCWQICDESIISEIVNEFSETENLYIADGHHRCASAVKVSVMRKESGKSDNDEQDYFLSVVFPDSELMIMDYNRVLKDLNGLSKDELLEQIDDYFDIEEIALSNNKPSKKGDIYMIFDDSEYCISLKKEFMSDDPVESLDVSVLQNFVLNPLLGIDDPKTNTRIDFVGGIRGVEELHRRIKTDCKLAFAMYPTSISELFSVADAGLLMPPKSTWFEPKLLSGLFIHEI